MIDKYENCRKKLEDLIHWYSDKKGKRNEATTRLHLINELLIDCLGWEKHNLTAEDSYNNQYTDYTISLTRPLLILEAKKEGDYFELPEGINSLIYPIKTICRDNNNLKKAIEQVCDYCQTRGVQIGVVSNGWQLVALIANRVDGIPPIEGNAYVFPSLELMHEKFLELWNILSTVGLEKKNIIKNLIGELIPELPPKLSSTIYNYPGVKNRNPFQTDMQILSDMVLEDIIKEKGVEKEFLLECYCKSGALSQYALITKEILNTRYKYLFEVEDNKASVAQAVDKKGITKDFSEVLASSLSIRPILLIGDVGVGKTIFTNNLIKIEAEKILENAITFVIDLGSQAVLSEILRTTIIDEMYRQFIEEHNLNIEESSFVRGAYHFEIIRFREGIYKPLFEKSDPKALDKEIEFLETKLKNKAEHLKKSLEHISRGQRKQIIIFIDNCDQRDDDTQQNAFLIAQELAQHWPVTVFVSLRPETFHRSIKSGTLSGYHPKVFTISPPRIDEVIEKRLNFAQKITRGEIPLASVKLNIQFSKLDTLIEVLKSSLKRNKLLLEGIENVSGGNIRQAIDMVKAFLGSGHVDTEKILSLNEDNLYKKQEPYLIPLHEFLRAVIFGDNVYYDPNRSPITNLFDVHFYDKNEHFLLPILLGTLHSHLLTGKDDGFLNTDKVYRWLQGFGFTAEQIDSTISLACERKLIETTERGTIIKSEKPPSMLRINTIGTYHICNLCNLFTYIDAIIVDTPLFNSEYRAKIKIGRDIKERLIKVEYFRQYLDEVWKYFDGKQTCFDWNQRSIELKSNIREIESQVARKENYELFS